MPDPDRNAVDLPEDRLTLVCGLADLTRQDRERLRAELEFAGRVLARISEGAGFCEDRGFGWGAQMERNEGTERLFASLRAWPISRRLLPRLRHLRHQEDPVIAWGTIPVDDVAVAELLLDDQDRFFGQFGEGWDARTIEVRLKPDVVWMRERTSASDKGDRPFDSCEETADYAEPPHGAFWHGLKAKFAGGVVEAVAALAARMGRTQVPCDLCGLTSHAFGIAGAHLTWTGPSRGGPVSVEVPPDALMPLRRALAAQDMVAIGAMNPAWMDGYCAERDASYCSLHLGELRSSV